MKLSLSKRERVLIIIVAYVVIGYLLIQFAILPGFKSYQDKQEQLQELTMEQTMIDAKIAIEASIISQNETRRAELDEVRAIYPAVMRNEQIDNLLTGLCVSNGLTPVNLSLSAAEPTLPTEQSSNRDEEQEDPGVFVTMTAHMTADGSMNQLLAVLRRVESMGHVRVSRLSFQNRFDSMGESGNRFTLQFDVTMMREDQE